jgi:hypothetical protein
MRFAPSDMRIDDVVAAKFVDTHENLARIEKAIIDHPRATLAEREVHSGIYKATNLLVDLALPKPGVIIDQMKDMNWSFAARRGLDPARIPSDFARYVESGARSIRMEFILTTMEDLVESEFGRAMHEERILRQRLQEVYSGRIAQNASYIIRYLLMLALSPTVKVDDIPVKMWGRYLPDTLTMAVDEVFAKERGRAMLTLFAQHPLEMPDIPLDHE